MRLRENEKSEAGASLLSRWFWVVSGIGLVWNLIGAMAFFGQMTMDTSSLSNAERVFHEAKPVWATIAFGVAVSAGVLGSIALLLRQRWAITTLTVSFFGIVLQGWIIGTFLI